MASLNKWSGIGNLGKDPKITDTQGGKKIASFSLACSESWKDKATGERKDRTEWINCVVYNEALAHVVSQYVKKGSKIYVEGALSTRKWTDKEGVERYSTEVVLQAFGGKIILLDGREERQQTPHEESKQNAYMVDDIDDYVPF